MTLRDDAETWLGRQKTTSMGDDDVDACRCCGYPARHGHPTTEACGIICALLSALSAAQLQRKPER